MSFSTHDGAHAPPGPRPARLRQIGYDRPRPGRGGAEVRYGGAIATDERQAFGAMLQRLRRAVGLSQQELAERAGLSLRGLADLERGARRHPYPATVRRLVQALGLDEAARAALLAAAQPDEP